jgi:DNA processing protein
VSDTPSAEERRYRMALLRAPGIGPRSYAKLLEVFGGATEVFSVLDGQLQSLGLSDASRQYIRSPDWKEVDLDLEWLADAGNRAVLFGAADYPPQLAEIHDAPPILFVRGDPSVLSRGQLAMVGSRNPSPSGEELAFAFSEQLARAGLVITSGLAFGVDAAAHRGALAANGVTIAVAGTGLDQVYPGRHRDLAAAIAERGAIVSEFPLRTPPAAQNFPRRNRIISGLSLGVLVVEAAVRSGSLITAKHALEQGREVFAIPGSIHNPMARGCHALIRQGAKLVETVADVVEELGPIASPITPSTDAGDLVQGDPALASEYQRLLECMGYDPISVDALVARTRLTAQEVSSMLLILEIKGYVRSQAGGMYVRQSLR